MTSLPSCPWRAGRRFLASLLVTSALVAAAPAASLAQAVGPSWQPQASERLVKLPPQYLKKSLDSDFADSELGVALRDTETKVRLKMQTLADLQGAIERADGEVRTELRHQFLAEKKAFIDTMNGKQELRRKHVKTRKQVLEAVLDRLNRESRADVSPARAQLVEKQKAARQRFESTFADVDLKLVSAMTTHESRYAREYAKNMASIQQLVDAVNAHPMNRNAEEDEGLSRADQIRRMIADSEAELALLEQEERALGYMAKLVALDAQGLAEEVEAASIGRDAPETPSLEAAVKVFVGSN
ncbi:MAG: hypothetical protein FJX11_18335 [Alphaproteobacteria bacterium]|nr:hypothetical protein [Alphaproteobacteria bacterium]